MKSFIKFLWIVALVMGMVFFAGCVTNTTIGGTSDAHGLFASGADIVSDGRMEIASYSVILGLFTSGYSEYAAAVEAAIAQGRHVSSVTKTYLFITTTTAYAR